MSTTQGMPAPPLMHDSSSVHALAHHGAKETEEEIELESTPNFSLNRVGSLFLDRSSNDDSNYYVLGSISRLCNEVDDITLAESSSTRTPAGSDSPELVPITRVPTGFQRDTPVFSWESRTVVSDGSSLEALLQKRPKAGSSLAPQSSSDPSDDEKSEAPSVGQFRPGTDLMQCPVLGCERTFKWKKNLHHHIRDKHPMDAAGLSIMRIQPAHVGAAHNGFRLQSITIAPSNHVVTMTTSGEPSLTCSECGKTFSRKGDLVHHKRYHTRSTDRPYKCDQCGQGFIHHKDLARHMPRHTGQRSFQCPFQDCHKNYTRKDNLNRHMRHDHGGLGVTGEAWNGEIAPAPAPALEYIPESQQETIHQQLPPLPVIPETHVPEMRGESQSTDGENHYLYQSTYRETTPSLGKRPGEDLERLATGIKPKRKPKEKWAHRLGCPFRKCRRDVFTTENSFRVCETTPHEFIIRLIEHMKRNHELFVCGECYLGFKSPDALNNHKLDSHHCGKCYLSFPTAESFDEHRKVCMAVEASTQEEIWQILYETLCGDGVRHNPSFDDDSLVDQTIEPNNRVRMQFINQQPLLQGQVPSLAKQLSSPMPSGNGQAPPVFRADEDTQLRLDPAGANSMHAVSNYSSYPSPPRATEAGAQLLVEVQNQRELISMLQGQLVASQTRAAALARARVQDIFRAAVERLASKRSPLKPRYESGYVEEMSHWPDEGGDQVVTARTHMVNRDVWEEDEPPVSLAMPALVPVPTQSRPITRGLACPSLTSESTLLTERDCFGGLATTSERCTIPFQSSNTASKEYEQDQFFLWGDDGDDILACKSCGRQLQMRNYELCCDGCSSQ